jgi:hypothetical protein
VCVVVCFLSFFFLLFIFLACSIILTAISFVARAQTIDDVDTHFENARGQILGFYSSELMSHAAIILGFIVGLFSLGRYVDNLLRSKKWFVRFIGYFALAVTFLLIAYSIGRLFFWSTLSSSIIFWVSSSEGCVIAPTGQTGWQPLQNTIHLLGFTTILSLLSFSSTLKAPTWQKSKHFPQTIHFS